MIQIVMFAMLIATAFQLVNISQILNLKIFIVILVSFSLFLFTKIDPVWIILTAGILGLLWKI